MWTTLGSGSFMGMIWGEPPGHRHSERVKSTGLELRHLSTNAKMPITSAKGKVPASSASSALVPCVDLIFNGSTFQTTRDEKSRCWWRDNGPKDVVQ